MKTIYFASEQFKEITKASKEDVAKLLVAYLRHEERGLFQLQRREESSTRIIYYLRLI